MTDDRDPTEPAADSDTDSGTLARLLARRRHVSLRRLMAPGPDAAALHRILDAAAQAPDHGALLPWRFVLVPPGRRDALAQAFADDLAARDPGSGAGALAAAGAKAHHAPVLLVAVLVDDPAAGKVPRTEKAVSLGCAIQDMLLMGASLGFSGGLASGSIVRAPSLRALLSLAPHEEAVCFVGFGTSSNDKPPRARPRPEQYFSIL